MSRHRAPGPAVIGGGYASRPKHRRSSETMWSEYIDLRDPEATADERQREDDRALGQWLRETKGIEVEESLRSIYGGAS